MNRFGMVIGLVLMCTAGMAEAQQGPVEKSIRPVARPETAPAIIRPAARPKEEAALVEIQVSTANQGFQQWIKGFRSRALSRGISAGVFDRAFRGVKYDPEVIAKDRHQSEFTKQIWDYLDSATSPVRIKNGKAALRKYSRTLDRIEARYGVEKEVVAAIWGVESAYGAQRGDVDIIQALATLSYDGRRGKFFEQQLIAALKILQSGDVRPRGMKGSWAGAMGHTQFIPTSYLAYAQDFNGDGKRDIWSNDPTDALASTAYYLAKFGWRKGQPWGVEVVFPKGFNFGLANRKILKLPSEWGALGIRAASGRPVPDYGRASILLPAGSAGAAFMIFNNFAVLERYNTADAYVIAVGHLSDRLAGGPPIKANWPRGYAPLSFRQKKEMQRRLTRKGFKLDKIDGIIGPNTINAIRAFQQSVGVTPDGYPSQELLKLLRRQ